MTEESVEKTIKMAGVRFRENWKVYDFDATGIDVAVGDRVIVDSERGPGFASVVRIRTVQRSGTAEEPAPEPSEKTEIPEGVEIEVGEEAPAASVAARPHVLKGTRKILRRANEDDLAREQRNREREAQAFAAAQTMIMERDMPMKLIRVEFSFDASRATFFFFSENRIDFRDLVKDLAHKVRSRIEMRQIGVRDVARMIGGFGPCGRELCCSSFLKNFEPVSIRMAKKQEMVLNPAKISGVCGRLLCCLSYEYEMYEANKRDQADLRQTAIKEKKDEEDQRLAEERKEVEAQKADEKKRQEERRQDQRRDRQKESGQKAARPEKKKDHQEKKKDQDKKTQPQQAEQRKRQPRPERQQQRQQQPPPQQEEKQHQPQAQQPQDQTRPPLAEGQQAQPDGDKTGKKKRRRFWRKKKKQGQGGEGQAPQGPQGGGNPQGG